MCVFVRVCCLCMCLCVRACVCVCVRARVWACDFPFILTTYMASHFLKKYHTASLNQFIESIVSIKV